MNRIPTEKRNWLHAGAEPLTAEGMGIALKATLLENHAVLSCRLHPLAVYEILAHGAIIYAEC
jgi:hypothetical protein